MCPRQHVVHSIARKCHQTQCQKCNATLFKCLHPSNQNPSLVSYTSFTVAFCTRSRDLSAPPSLVLHVHPPPSLCNFSRSTGLTDASTMPNPPIATSADLLCCDEAPLTSVSEVRTCFARVSKRTFGGVGLRLWEGELDAVWTRLSGADGVSARDVDLSMRSVLSPSFRRREVWCDIASRKLSINSTIPR